MTACKQCKHFSSTGPIWHQQYCMSPATKMPDEFNPVEGKLTEPDQPHPHVRDINKGNCEFYEEVKS